MGASIAQIEEVMTQKGLKVEQVTFSIQINRIKDRDGNVWEIVTTAHNERMAKEYDIPTLTVRFGKKDVIYAPKDWLLKIKRKQ